jgi:hypothetical protein
VFPAPPAPVVTALPVPGLPVLPAEPVPVGCPPPPTLPVQPANPANNKPTSALRMERVI